jgi:3-oxoacyl-[acyl-carrier-protein] synthase-3
MKPMTIRGLGTYLPGESFSNQDIERWYGPFVAALSEEMGVESRHWSVDPDTGTLREENAAAASRAAERALDDAGMRASDVDLIILATVTPDFMLPGPAAFVQERLGANRATVIDLRAGCFGMAQAVAIAAQFLESESCDNVLVIGSELFSPLMHAALRNAERFRPRQRTMMRVTAALFGDGAGAMVVARASSSDPDRVVECRTHSIGCGRPPGIVSAIGGIKMPFFLPQDCRDAEPMVHDYAAIGRFFNEVANRLFDSGGDEPHGRLEDIALIVPAQANNQIPDAVTKVLVERCGDESFGEQTRSKIFVDIHDVGNTGAASIYIALEKIRRNGRVRAGDKVLLVPAEATKWFFGTILLVH